jgi:hypothetical protein
MEEKTYFGRAGGNVASPQYADIIRELGAASRSSGATPSCLALAGGIGDLLHGFLGNRVCLFGTRLVIMSVNHVAWIEDGRKNTCGLWLSACTEAGLVCVN